MEKRRKKKMRKLEDKFTRSTLDERSSQETAQRNWREKVTYETFQVYFPEQNDLSMQTKRESRVPRQWLIINHTKVMSLWNLKTLGQRQASRWGAGDRWSPKKMENMNSFGFFSSTLEVEDQHLKNSEEKYFSTDVSIQPNCQLSMRKNKDVFRYSVYQKFYITCTLCQIIT